MSPTSYQAAPLRDIGAGNGNRTRTILSYHGILSPGRLPIPPLRRISSALPKYYITGFCVCQYLLPKKLRKSWEKLRFFSFLWHGQGRWGKSFISCIFFRNMVQYSICFYFDNYSGRGELFWRLLFLRAQKRRMRTGLCRISAIFGTIWWFLILTAGLVLFGLRREGFAWGTALPSICRRPSGASCEKTAFLMLAPVRWSTREWGS